MSKKSNNQGRGFEYACLSELVDAISKHRHVSVIQDSCLESAYDAYKSLSDTQKQEYKKGAAAMIPAIFECEPRLIEHDPDILELCIQPDKAGEIGDVRDIIISRKEHKWEIGLSIKHNHFAVKHSRLSPTIDFANKWFGIPCSKSYWHDIEPIFNLLSEEQKRGTKFSEIYNKEERIYQPIMDAFIREIKRLYLKHKNIPAKLVEYLLSKYDFYKVISIDNKHVTQIQAYNLHNTLNKSAKRSKPTIIIPVASLPKRIISMDLYPGRLNTAELYLDKGWSFTFRIHNAETYAIPSLKFDIQIKGMPFDILTINCIWK